MTGGPAGARRPTRPFLDGPDPSGSGSLSPRKWTPPPETGLGRARRLAQFIPLVGAWSLASSQRPALTKAERDLLTLVYLSTRRSRSLLIQLPGAVHRLPLLAAAMIAADTLDIARPDLARLTGDVPPPGPVALVTARTLRRHELELLDVATVPVAPALHPHRLRGDGLTSPLRGGRPRPVTGAARLLFVAPTSGFPPVVGVPPRAVLIDAAAEAPCDWLAEAWDWAAAHGSVVVAFADLHQDIPLTPTATGGSRDPVPPPRPPEPGLQPAIGTDNRYRWIVDWPWLRRLAGPLQTQSAARADGSDHAASVDVRGRAHLLAVPDPRFAALAEVRERLSRLRDPAGRPAPLPICRAARMTRLLSELPTTTVDYDRVAPRYGGRTLRRLLDDILDADLRNDFPPSWRARVAADWGAVRAILNTTYKALEAQNPATAVIADLVEDAYRTRQRLDIVCGSRSAQDALTGRLLSNGTLRLDDPPLVTIRSIGIVEEVQPQRTTLLIGPPAARWHGRLSAADFGELVVLGIPGDASRLCHALRRAYTDPDPGQAHEARQSTVAALTGAMTDDPELNGDETPVGVITTLVDHRPGTEVRLPDPSALVAVALTYPNDGPDLDITDLEAEPDCTASGPEPERHAQGTLVRALPVVVQSTALSDAATVPTIAFLLPAAARVQRLRDQDIQLFPVADLAPGMTLIGLSEPERQTLFDRIRPLLMEQRPELVRMLLQLWQVAVDDARAICGSVTELTARLAQLGADVTASAVSQWSDPRRIGPLEPRNVERIGRIAGNRVVSGEAKRIAAVMRAVRSRHATVGSALVRLAGWHATGDTDALDRAAAVVGPEITDLAADLTAWRIFVVGEETLAPASALRRPLTIDAAARLCQRAPDASVQTCQPGQENRPVEESIITLAPWDLANL